ncbi:P-type conjugative transfer protein TrbJ [Parvularcula oceani]|uniref:P-type conjugative transfer protein TrbJ n=1 Tax=Parvularcula oceani TaxID=1247963 RepID=UPI0004E2279B|nr:P-type conjugative transfer protein TrbJ [Parvularcula oceani]
MKKTLAALFAVSALGIASLPSANALFGVGDIVIDPTNLAQNVLTAERTLRQIQNQVRQLANEARMLQNMANDLRTLPTSVMSDLRRDLYELETLIGSARGIAYDAVGIDDAYGTVFSASYDPNVVTAASLAADATTRFGLNHAAVEDSLRAQVRTIDALRADQITLEDLFRESQGATGNLSALQAGNQMQALAIKQQMQTQALLAAQARADATAQAADLAEAAAAKARLARFRGDGNRYTPSG